MFWVGTLFQIERWSVGRGVGGVMLDVRKDPELGYLQHFVSIFGINSYLQFLPMHNVLIQLFHSMGDKTRYIDTSWFNSI